MTDLDACREAFEKWCVELGMNAERADGKNGYAHIETQNHWNTYQAAWNTLNQAKGGDTMVCACDGERAKVGPYWTCKKCGAEI